jgi:hypothetical protein
VGERALTLVLFRGVSRPRLGWLAALPSDSLQVIQASPLGEQLGRTRMFFSVAQAVDSYQNQPEHA